MSWQWLPRVAGKIPGMGVSTGDSTTLLARYQHWRRLGLSMNNRLVKSLPKPVLDEGGKRLGILKKNVLVFDSEDEMAVFMDFCIHDVRPHGRNAVEAILADSPPPTDSDEMVLLK